MNRNDSADICQQFESINDPSADVRQQYETSDDPLNPWPGLDPLRIALVLCRKGVCSDLNSDLSQGKSWLQLTGYQRLYYIFKFRELSTTLKQDVLSAASAPAAEHTKASLTKTRSTEARSMRKPRSTFDDYIRLFHMYNDPSLASLWRHVLSSTVLSDEEPGLSKQHYIECLVKEFNDYDKNGYTNCTMDVVPMPDGRVLSTPKVGMETAYEACKGLNPSNRSNPTRDLDWLVARIKEIKRDLMAVNYVRYINSGLPHMENPYIPFKQFVTEDAKQQYALHLFQGFVDVILQEDELGTGLGRPASSCWLYFDRITVMGAVRARCRYCGHTFAINTCRLMAHLSGRMTASLSGVTLCTKTPPYVAKMLAQEFDNEQLRKKKNQQIAQLKQQRFSRTLPAVFEGVIAKDLGDSASSVSSVKPQSDSSISDSDAEGQLTEPAEDDREATKGPFVSIHPTNIYSGTATKPEEVNNGASRAPLKPGVQIPTVSPPDQDSSVLLSMVSTAPLDDKGPVNDTLKKRPSVTPELPNCKRRFERQGANEAKTKLSDHQCSQSNVILGTFPQGTPCLSNPWESSVYMSMRTGPAALNQMENSGLPPAAPALMNQFNIMNNVPIVMVDPRVGSPRGADFQGGMGHPQHFQPADLSACTALSGHNFFTPAFVVPQQLQAGRTNLHQHATAAPPSPRDRQLFQARVPMHLQSHGSMMIPSVDTRPSYYPVIEAENARSKSDSMSAVDCVYNAQGQRLQMSGNWMVGSNAGYQQQLPFMHDLYMHQQVYHQHHHLASNGGQFINYGANYSNSNSAMRYDCNQMSTISGYDSHNGSNPPIDYNSATVNSTNVSTGNPDGGDVRQPCTLPLMLSQLGANYQ